MKNHYKLALPVAVIAALTASAQVADVSSAKTKKPEDKNGIPQVVFQDPPTVFSSSKPEWHAPPEPIEAYLIEGHTDRVDQMIEQLSQPHKPADNVYSCLIELRKDAPAFQATMLANLFNHMVDASMPGYKDKAKLTALPDAWITEQQSRINLRAKECLAFVPAAAPEFNPAFDDKNEAAKHEREQGFRALQQMGYAMHDFAYDASLSTENMKLPTAGFCRAMSQAADSWSSIYSKIPEGVEKDNFEVYLDKYRSGIYRVCPGQYFR